MNKYLKIAIIVLVAGVVGYGIYWWLTRNKGATDANGNPLPPPPATQPPASTALQSTDSGAGLAAINRRIGEILGSSAWVTIQSKVQAQTDILMGVSAAKRGWYNNNISRPPITSAKDVPFNLNALQKASLQQFAGIGAAASNTSAFDTAAQVRGANSDMMGSIGTCFVEDAQLADQTNFNRQVICQQNQNCGNNYKDLGGHAMAGINVALGDMKKMADAWYHGAIVFDHSVTDQAIQDLRAAGWKFVGYDF